MSLERLFARFAPNPVHPFDLCLMTCSTRSVLQALGSVLIGSRAYSPLQLLQFLQRIHRREGVDVEGLEFFV